MKKLFTLLLVAGLFTFTSCGGGKGGEQKNDTTPAADTAAKKVESEVKDIPAADTTAKPKVDSTVVDTVKKTEGETKDTTKKK